jgi:hypothetical protein
MTHSGLMRSWRADAFVHNKKNFRFYPIAIFAVLLLLASTSAIIGMLYAGIVHGTFARNPLSAPLVIGIVGVMIYAGVQTLRLRSSRTLIAVLLFMTVGVIAYTFVNNPNADQTWRYLVLGILWPLVILGWPTWWWLEGDKKPTETQTGA